MAGKFICGGEKYMLAGQKGDSIILPVLFSSLPTQIKTNGYSLALKTEFHVSLVCIGKIIEKHKVKIPNFIEKIIEDFCDFIKSNKIDLVRYRNEFKFVSEHENRTVVVMCDISNLDGFFALINQKYGLNVEYPPTHVTLYTLTGLGIFLIDSNDMETLTMPIENPGLVLPKV